MLSPASAQQGTAHLLDATTGAYTYTPDPQASGTDPFSFEAHDGVAASNVATVTITLVPPSTGLVVAYRFDAGSGTTATSNNGQPSLSPPDETLLPELTHAVYTRNAAGVARLYIDGIEWAQGSVGGQMSAWDTRYRLALGNELTGDRPWLGELHGVAIYHRALSQAEVDQSFAAGPTTTNELIASKH